MWVGTLQLTQYPEVEETERVRTEDGYREVKRRPPRHPLAISAGPFTKRRIALDITRGSLHIARPAPCLAADGVMPFKRPKNALTTLHRPGETQSTVTGHQELMSGATRRKAIRA